MLSTVDALGATDMTENDDVESVHLDRDVMEVTRPELTAVGHPMLDGLGLCHAEDLG